MPTIAIYMDSLLLLEAFSVIMGLLFIILLIQENIWCWLFGIVSSTGFAFLMFNSRLYSETILYVFYVFVGFYGIYKWKERDNAKIVITKTKLSNIILIMLVGALLSFGVGYYFDNHSNSERPFADSGATAHCFHSISFFEPGSLRPESRTVRLADETSVM